MSKALELIETWEETLDFGSDRKMWAHVDLMVDELRRLAEIERKYNEIMAQEPVAWLHVLDCGGGDFEYNFHPMNERPEGNYHLYTLPKD